MNEPIEERPLDKALREFIDRMKQAKQEDRERAMEALHSEFCMYCCGDSLPCHCMNDE